MKAGKTAAALALAGALMLPGAGAPARAADTIKIGVLHSLSGTMAISESTLKDTVLTMVDDINSRGGLLGKKVEAVVVDPASNWPLFAEKARELIQKDKVAALRVIGLSGREATPAGALSHGQKQWLEIGMLLVQDQRRLLLDEPVAGMTDRETELTAELILKLAGERTLVVVEHDMEFVRNLGARVTVLHEGAVLADGSIEHVQSQPAVIDVYLGR